MLKKWTAEFIGTAWLVLGGCGAAVLAAAYPDLGIGFVGVSLAFGLTVLTMAYAIGHVSGCHLNPAVTFGLWAGGRFQGRDVPGYVVAQLLGGAAGAAILYLIASGHAGFNLADGFASNGYGAHSPAGYSLGACFISEFILTCAFLFVIMGATHGSAPRGFAPLAIGLALTLIHLISIPVTNTSVNPARSTGPALFVGAWALQQLWLFWVAPLAGAAAGGVIYRWLSAEDPVPVSVSGAVRLPCVLAILILALLTPGTDRAASPGLPIADFSSEDTDLMMKNAREALDSSGPEVKREWSNPKTGAFGFARVLSQFVATDGLLCKRLLVGNTAKGNPGESAYTFCKVADRGWVVNDGATPKAASRD